MEYLLFIITLLLLSFIYLINKNCNCLLVISNAILLVILLNLYITKETFNVNETAFLSENPVNEMMMQQEMDIETLSENIGILKSMYKEKADRDDITTQTISPIKINNTCKT
jgi:hypothetical protein